MVKKNLFVLIFVTALSYILVGQEQIAQENLMLTYQVKFNYLESLYNLEHGTIISRWYETADPEMTDPTIDFIPPEDYKRKELFKDYNKKVIYSDYTILGGEFYLKDNMPLIKWELLSENDIILGYACKLAKTEFRDRKYKAWYTTELLVPDGPFKFQGLPGMILKVETIEGEEPYSMECIAISKKKSNLSELLKKYLKKKERKLMNWDEIVLKTEKQIQKVSGSIKADAESSGDSGYQTLIKMDNFPEVVNKKFQTEGILIEY